MTESWRPELERIERESLRGSEVAAVREAMNEIADLRAKLAVTERLRSPLQAYQDAHADCEGTEPFDSARAALADETEGS